MSRLTKIGVLGLLCVVAILIVLPIISHRQPSALFIHVDSLPWQTVIVESDNLPSPVRFERDRAELMISPIVHGVYRIGIQLANGQTIWSEFLHSNVKVRHRIDVVITSSSVGFHFRQTANESIKLFDGDVRPDAATQQKPFRLDWI